MKFKKTDQNKPGESYRPDWEAKGIWLEIKTHPQAIRTIRDGLLQLAYAISERPDLKAYLFLIEPSISEMRLREEWDKAEKTFRPEIIKKLIIFICKEGRFIGIPSNPSPELCEDLELIRQDEFSHVGIRLPSPVYNSEIIKILICRWFMKQGPMTLNWIGEAAGCAYRTVAGTLESLGNAILRHSDRSVELRFFPKDAWIQLLATSAKSRMTMKYADSSGQPRSPDSLIRRLKKLQRSDIAVGGILGARHYYPEIDMIGTPRLDLAIHCPDKYADISFVEQLDPALKKEDNPEVPPALVLHFIRRKENIFEKSFDFLPWADPVECLLDLHEMKLEPQALDFLNTMISKEKSL